MNKTKARILTLVCLSDTHELHREVEVPPGDILIHAGDFTFMSGRRSQIKDFDLWLGEPCQRSEVCTRSAKARTRRWRGCRRL